MPATISSRTPEGRRRRCPNCGHVSKVLVSIMPIADAACPICGSLLLPRHAVCTSRSSRNHGVRSRSYAAGRALRRAIDRLVAWARNSSSRAPGKKVAEPTAASGSVYDPWLDA